MVRSIVPQDQLFQHRQILQRILDGEITVQPFLQRTIESFHHAGLGVAAGGKMIYALSCHQGLKRLVVKFFAVVRLQFGRSTSVATFQNFLESRRHVFPRLGFDGFHSRVLGQHVHHRQEISIPAIVSSNGPHFDQIGRPLFVYAHDQDR